MKKWLLLFIILISCIIPVYAQNDQIINARNTNIQITAPNSPSGTVPWSTLANQTYVLAPINPDYGFCVSIVNNNTTSSHTFTVNAFQTGDSNALDYSHNTGRYATLSIVGTPSPVAANTTSTFFVRSNGAAKIAFAFSGASTQAGSPDTVDIYAVQTTAAGCGTVNPSTGQGYSLSTPNTGTSSAPPILSISDGLSQAFMVSQSITNPSGNPAVIEVHNTNGTGKSLYYNKAIISCSAACTVAVNTLTATGTCSASSIGNIKITSGVTSIAAANNTCTVNPNQAFQFVSGLPIGAGQNIVIDLQGFIALGTSTNGLWIQVNTFTGTISASLLWYEK